MIVISFAVVKFYAFAILYVLIVMQIKLVVVVVVVIPQRKSLLSDSQNTAGSVQQLQVYFCNKFLLCRFNNFKAGTFCLFNEGNVVQ